MIKQFIDKLLGGNDIITDANAAKFFTKSQTVTDFGRKYFGFCAGEDSVGQRAMQNLDALPDAMLDNMIYRVLLIASDVVKPDGGMPVYYPRDDRLRALLDKEDLLEKDDQGKSFLRAGNIVGKLKKLLFTVEKNDKNATVRAVVSADAASTALAYVTESSIAAKTRTAAAAARSKAAASQ